MIAIRRSSFLLTLVALLAGLLCAPTQASAAANWKVLFLVYKNTDVTYTYDNGKSYTMTSSMSQLDLDRTTRYSNDFVAHINSWSGGRATITKTMVYPTTKITRVEKRADDCYMITPGTLAADLDKYAPKGKYDAVMVRWKSDNWAEGTAWDTWTGVHPSRRIPTDCYAGLTWMQFDASQNYTGFSQLPLPGAHLDWDAWDQEFGDEGMVHEFLHNVEGWYRGVRGATRLPGLHNGSPYGYDRCMVVGSRTCTYQPFYQAYMRYQLYDSVDRCCWGVSPTAWAMPTPSMVY